MSRGLGTGAGREAEIPELRGEAKWVGQRQTPGKVATRCRCPMATLLAPTQSRPSGEPGELRDVLGTWRERVLWDGEKGGD